MKLNDIADNGMRLDMKELAFDRNLATEIQSRLIGLGILDPPADGDFGPVSRSALETFAKIKKIPLAGYIDTQLADALIESDPETLFPLALSNTLASKLIQYMLIKKIWFSRLPRHITIVYVEGMNADGTLNENEPNRFNDRRLTIGIESGSPKILGNWDATTEPSAFYTKHPLNPKGAARIAFGQYKAWRVGAHPRSGGAGSHEALVQVGDVKVHRDLNKDFKRTGDPTEVGSGFGLNQHWGYDYPLNDVGRASAGCLVGRTRESHKEFMKIIKTDPRFAASKGYKFVTTIIDGDDFKETVG